MSTPSRFHDLQVARVSPEAAGAVALALRVPPGLHSTFDFQPGQYLTLRSRIDGAELRRSYSICCTRGHLQQRGELVIGIRPVAGGVFSNWAASQLRPGDTLAVLPPQGGFVSRRPRALHRVGFAAGSGITPILSILSSTLQEQAQAKFTLVYGNRNMASVMFNEALQDLKDRYPDRLTLIHILSRQAQEVDLLQGRIDADKVRALMATLLPPASMDEVFVCGPQAMIDATLAALHAAGVPQRQVYAERFSAPQATAAPSDPNPATPAALTAPAGPAPSAAPVALSVKLDGKVHTLPMRPDERVLDVALAAGLDLPYSCKAGVCATCRCKVTQGQVAMERNFGLEAAETAQGFVLSCQARPLSAEVGVSFDER